MATTEAKSIIRNEWEHLILSYEILQISVKYVPFKNTELKVFAAATQLAFIKIFIIRFYGICFANSIHSDEFSLYKDLDIKLGFRSKLVELRNRYAHVKKSPIPEELKTTLAEIREWFLEAEKCLEDKLGEPGALKKMHAERLKYAQAGWKALA